MNILAIGDVVGSVGCRFLRGWIDVCMHIIRKRNAAEAGAKHTDKQQRQQHAGYHMQDARSFSFASCQFGFLLARRIDAAGLIRSDG